MKIDERKTGTSKAGGDGNRALQEHAQALAIAALGFLAADEERLERFLGLSGLDPSQLRLAAKNPGFFVAVLDHMVNDKPLLMAFANAQPCDPALVLRARNLLDPQDAEMP